MYPTAPTLPYPSWGPYIIYSVIGNAKVASVPWKHGAVGSIPAPVDHKHHRGIDDYGYRQGCNSCVHCVPRGFDSFCPTNSHGRVLERHTSDA